MGVYPFSVRFGFLFSIFYQMMIRSNVIQRPLTLTLSRGERGKRTRILALLSISIDSVLNHEPWFLFPLLPGEG
jgi:hypothetical protein